MVNKAKRKNLTGPGAGEIPQWLRTPAALLEDSGLNPNTHIKW